MTLSTLATLCADAAASIAAPRSPDPWAADNSPTQSALHIQAKYPRSIVACVQLRHSHSYSDSPPKHLHRAARQGLQRRVRTAPRPDCGCWPKLCEHGCCGGGMRCSRAAGWRVRMRDFRGMMVARAWRVWLMAICRRMRRGCCRGRCLGAFVVRRCLLWRFCEFGLGWGGVGWVVEAWWREMFYTGWTGDVELDCSSCDVTINLRRSCRQRYVKTSCLPTVAISAKNNM
jgi:hypothetical protein